MAIYAVETLKIAMHHKIHNIELSIFEILRTHLEKSNRAGKHNSGRKVLCYDPTEVDHGTVG